MLWPRVATPRQAPLCPGFDHEGTPLSHPIRFTSRPVTAILLEAGVVNDEQIATGLALQLENGKRIGETLVEMGAVTEADLCWALARQLEIPFVDVESSAIDLELLRSFPEGLLERLQVLPLMRTDQGLSIAIADPTDTGAIEELEHGAGVPLEVSIATPSAIARVLAQAFGHRPEVRPPRAAPTTEPQFGVDWDRSGSVFLEFHLELARRARATELHFVPEAGRVRVFHRVRGRLVHTANEAPYVIYSLLARLESLGGPAFDGRDLHACGRARASIGGADFELGISLLHQDAGVAVVLALHTSRSRSTSLFDLGFDLADETRLRGVAAGPAGLAIVCGPPRSGVTSTLAALFAILVGEGRRTLAIHDRTTNGYPLEQSLQLEAATARAAWQEIAVRQDLDVIALDGALTGEHAHAMLSPAASGRWLLAGTDWCDAGALIDHLLASPGGRAALAGRVRMVVQQRLARGEDAAGGASAAPHDETGRVALIEVLAITQPMRILLRDGGGAAELAALARADGVVTLGERARSAIAEGRMSADEAARVLG